MNLLRLALILFAAPAMAQDIDETAPAIAAIFDTARAECEIDVAQDPSAPKPDLLIHPGAVTWADLDGEGEPNDTIVDFNHVYCSLNYSLWHGSGGSILHLVRNGAVSASWTGGLWRVIDFAQSPLVLIGRHGTACDGYGAQPCVQAISVTADGFSTTVNGQPLEQDGRD